MGSDCPDCLHVHCSLHTTKARGSRYHSVLLSSSRGWLRKLAIAEMRLAAAQGNFRSARALVSAQIRTKGFSSRRSDYMLVAAQEEVRLARVDVRKKESSFLHCMRDIVEGKKP